MFLILTAFVPYALSVARVLLTELEKTSEQVKRPSVSVLTSPEQLYQVTAADLSSANARHGPKVLRHAILHGHVGQQRSIPKKRERFFSRFDEELIRCIRGSGPNSWEIRQVYLVPSEERLDMMLSRLAQTEGQAKNHTVKVFVPPFGFSYLSTLLIDRDVGSLATDDLSLYRVKAGLQITGEAAISVLCDYFDSLWTNPTAYTIRSVNRLDAVGIEDVRARLRDPRLAPQEHHV
jgi:hypothetical protein